MEEESKFINLLPFSKIASLSGGKVTLHTDNLKVILESVSHMSKYTPVGIAGVLGNKLTGSYFFSNFLVQYVSKSGASDWMREVINDIKVWATTMERDIKWGYPRSVKFNATDDNMNGIFLYPKPYLVNKTDDDQVLLWIIHGQVSQVCNEELLTKFFTLACSMCMEVLFRETEDSKLAYQYRQILRNPQPLISIRDLCNSATFVFRTRVKTSHVILNTTEMHNIPETAVIRSRQERKKTFPIYDFVFVIEDPTKSVSKSKTVTTEADTIYIVPQISPIVKTFLKTENIVAKRTSTGVLKLGDMYQFFKTVAKKANKWEKLSQSFPTTEKIIKAKEDLETLESYKQAFDAEIANKEKKENDGMPDEIKCPTCLEVYHDKVFLCANGHALCDKCLKRVFVCPECRAALGNTVVRCRPLEKMVSEWLWDCPYRDRGCNEQFGCKEMATHVQACGWRLDVDPELLLEEVKTDIAETLAELKRLESIQEADFGRKYQELMGRSRRRNPCAIL